MKKTYTVESRDRLYECGHKHKTEEAAARCLKRLRRANPAKWYVADILRDGERKNGIGLYENE